MSHQDTSNIERRTGATGDKEINKFVKERGKMGQYQKALRVAKNPE